MWPQHFVIFCVSGTKTCRIVIKSDAWSELREQFRTLDVFEINAENSRIPRIERRALREEVECDTLVNAVGVRLEEAVLKTKLCAEIF